MTEKRRREIYSLTPYAVVSTGSKGVLGRFLYFASALTYAESRRAGGLPCWIEERGYRIAEQAVSP